MAFVQLTFNQFVDPEWIIEFLIQNGNHAAIVGEYEKLKQGNLHISYLEQTSFENFISAGCQPEDKGHSKE